MSKEAWKTLIVSPNYSQVSLNMQLLVVFIEPNPQTDFLDATQANDLVQNLVALIFFIEKNWLMIYQLYDDDCKQNIYYILVYAYGPKFLFKGKKYWKCRSS